MQRLPLILLGLTGAFMFQACAARDLVSGGLETVPGVVIDYRPKSSGVYLGSPSIAIWTNGDYVVTHDYFGPRSTQSETAVFVSRNQGQTWRKSCVLTGQFWSTLFVHHGALYLLGTSRAYGAAVIRRSIDGGRTWTVPKDAASGRLLANPQNHGAPVPVVVHNGRIWRAMEDARGPGGWGPCFRAFMLSAPEDADLLNAANWRLSNEVGGNTNWLEGKFGGWLEGNAVISPEGKIVDLLRCEVHTARERAALVRISDDGKTASFDPDRDFVDFPGGAKKFTVRFDPESGNYWSLANIVPPQDRSNQPGATRNTLALTCSPDLVRWRVCRELLHHDQPDKFGFQYADWQFEGEDLVVVVRTAFSDATGGAHSYHDANYITFHRLEHFRHYAVARPSSQKP